MSRRRFLAAGAGFLAVPPALTSCKSSPRGPNVILITVDTLRADHLGAYGYGRNTSPHIDRFAKEGILFRNAFSHAPETGPALASLLASQYPHETKVGRNQFLLLPGVETLPEILKASGYRTAAIVSSIVLDRGSGFEQGFDDYDDQLEDPIPGGVERIGPKTTRAAIQWLEENHRRPFFLWVHYNDPHGPYTPPPPYDTMFLQPPRAKTIELPVNPTPNGKGGIPSYQVLGSHRDPAYYVAQYDGEIRFVDHAIGELLDRIRVLGLLDSSMIIFTADHGEGMGEHDYYFAHRELLYNGLIHVPLIMRVPGQRAGRSEIHSPVAHVDVLPTITATLARKSSWPPKGLNLLAPQEDREIFAETHQGGAGGARFSLMRNGLKLIRSGDSYELYDVSTDFSETVDLMGRESADSAKVADLRSRLEDLQRQDVLPMVQPKSRYMGEVARKRLRALGYVQ